MVYGNLPETSEQFVDRMRAMGMRIGQRTIFFDPASCTLDVSRPWLIEIGDNVTMAPRVHILAHDASTKKALGYSRIGLVNIGSNVFIGAESVVLPGVTIGDNVVIGAGSVVTKDIPSNVVAVGNPCKVMREVGEKDKEFYFKDKKIRTLCCKINC